MYASIVLAAVLTLGANYDASAVDEVGNSNGAHDQHHAHRHSANDQIANGQALQPKYTRTIGNYAPPAVRLTDSNGEKVVLSDLLAEDNPVLIQFIFTSCATICPLLSATFARGQSALASTNDGYRMLSISIDPEYDTPKRLTAYAERNGASENWTFLTGSKGDIGKVLRAFNVLYQGDNKMYHRPYTFLRARADTPWIRIDGFLTVNELVQEYRTALDSADVALN